MSKPRKVVVSDSTPLIYLAKIGKLDLFKQVFKEVFIPEAVFKEAVTQGKALNISDASIIEKALGQWIIKEEVKPEVDTEFSFLDTNIRLGSGEKEAVKLCKQLDAEYFIVDDKEARRVSRILNIQPIGTCGVIAQAYRQGSITNKEALLILDSLLKAGFRISSTLYRRIIEDLGISL